MAVRIKDVAAHCGVSPGAVSQVLRDRNHSRFPEKTRERILKAAEEMGYRPNNLSVGLRRRRSDLLSLVIPWNNPELMDVVEQTARRFDFKIMVNFTSSPDTGREISSLDNALDWQVDGILWLPYGGAADYPERLVDRLQASRTHVLFLQRRLPGIEGMLVGFDYRQGIADAVRHLAEQGYRRICYSTISASPFELKLRRREYFQDALRQSGLDGEYVVLQNRADADLATPAAEWLASLPAGPNAVIGDIDWLTLELFLAARARGIRVPEELGLITNGDHLVGNRTRISRLTEPSLTALRVDYSRQAALAVEHLADLVAGEEIPKEDIILPHLLVVGGSTCRVN